MKPGSSVVCGVDHSPGARAAARVAIALADRLGSHVTLVHVVQPPIPQRELGMAALASDYTVLQDLRDNAVDLLDELARELAPDRDTTVEVRIGNASEAIAAVAEESGAELVVVGSRGLGSVRALVLGSVSQQLAARSPCPVVVVPESGGTFGDGPIVCAVDDSEGSRSAIATAAELAERLDATLLLAYAQPDDAPASQGEELLARVAVESRLGASAEKIVLPGEPADAIVDSASKRGALMIVVGSRGRGALASAALGSVSAAVAARAPCPVTVVRAPA